MKRLSDITATLITLISTQIDLIHADMRDLLDRKAQELKDRQSARSAANATSTTPAAAPKN